MPIPGIQHLQTADLKDFRFNLGNFDGAPARHPERFPRIGHHPCPPRAYLLPAESIQHEISHFNTKHQGGRKFHLGPNQKCVPDLNSWPFPAAIVGGLGLQNEKLGKENSEECRRGANLPPPGSEADSLTRTLKFSSVYSSLHLEVTRVLPLHQKTAVAIGWTGYVEVMLSLRSFCPEATLSCLRQHHRCSTSFEGRGCPHRKRGVTTDGFFLFSAVCLEPPAPSSYTDTLVQVRMQIQQKLKWLGRDVPKCLSNHTSSAIHCLGSNSEYMSETLAPLLKKGNLSIREVL